jgi:hypothetical protein
VNRRARNQISRSREMSVRAAELLDEGAGDAAVAAQLAEEFGQHVTARTVGSFRRRDYAPVARERLRRIEGAHEIEMIVSAARGSGMTFAEGTQEILARMMYEALRKAREGDGDLDAASLTKIGRSTAKIIELSIEQQKLDMQRQKEEAAARLRDAARRKVSGDELVKVVDDVMGLS